MPLGDTLERGHPPVPGRVNFGVAPRFFLGSSKVPVTYLRETIEKPKKKDGLTPVLTLRETGVAEAGEGHKVTG